MSVTFSLMKLCKDIGYTPSKYDLLDSREKRNLVKQLDDYRDDFELFDNYFKENFTGKFSDGKEHSLFELFKFNFYSNRMKKYYKYIKENYKDYLIFVDEKGNQHYSFVYDERCYKQGWFLKDKFFRRENSFFYAFTKEEMDKLLKCYVNTDKYYEFNNFRENFDNDTIFKLAF